MVNTLEELFPEIAEDVEDPGFTDDLTAADAFLEAILRESQQEQPPEERAELELFFSSEKDLETYMKNEESKGFHFRVLRTVKEKSLKVWCCHRYGSKRFRKDRVVGGTSGKSRPIQKSTSKIGCTCSLSATFHENGIISVIYNTKHFNHYPGSFSELAYLRKNKELIGRIERMIEDGLDHHALATHLLMVQKDIADIRNGAIPKQNEFFTRDDLYNIVSRIINRKFKKNEDEKESANIWIQELGKLHI